MCSSICQTARGVIATVSSYSGVCVLNNQKRHCRRVWLTGLDRVARDGTARTDPQQILTKCDGSCTGPQHSKARNAQANFIVVCCSTTCQSLRSDEQPGRTSDRHHSFFCMLTLHVHFTNTSRCAKFSLVQRPVSTITYSLEGWQQGHDCSGRVSSEPPANAD